MQKSFNALQPLRFVAISLAAGILMTACQSQESKKTDVQVETTDMKTDPKMDSLPVIDTITKSSTRPETIKNAPATNN